MTYTTSEKKTFKMKDVKERENISTKDEVLEGNDIVEEGMNIRNEYKPFTI